MAVRGLTGMSGGPAGFLLTSAASGGGAGGTVQTIRIEQMPLKIIAADIPEKLDPKKDQEPPVEPTT